jgi:hypothetical protein
LTGTNQFPSDQLTEHNRILSEMTMQEFDGPAGYGFRATLLPPDDRATADSMACLARWNLTLPGQHPFWERYCLSVCHLRDCAALTPANKESPDRTHEINVTAIDPNYPNEEFQKGGVAFPLPINHVVQIISTDAKAVEVAEFMVQRLVDGQELAEPSGITGARERFRNSVIKACDK